MSSPGLTKKITGSIYSKLAIAFVLACITVALAWAVTKGTFNRMLGTVQQISAPNPKLKLVNHLFRDVIKLEQRQRIQALKNTRNAYNPYIKESQQIQRMLDTLRDMSTQNTVQYRRVDSMKNLLFQRDHLFISYLQLNNRFSRDTQLSVKVHTLSAFLTSDSAKMDSSVITTEHKITTTKLVGADSASQNPPQERSFWDKIFGRKKPSEITHVQKQIQEELNVRIDTLALAKEDSLMSALGYALQDIETARENKRVTLTAQQMQIIRASNTIISQLLEMLQDIESEEIQRTELNNRNATFLVDHSIQRISFIMIVFIAGAGVLIFLIVADVARSNQYRRELLLAKEEAEHLEKVKQRFLSNMSHELRTPLQTILGFSEQLKDQQNPQPQDIDIIYRSSRHLLQIVNEVLDYSRIVSGKFNFSIAPFEMTALLREVAETIQVQVRQKGLEFNFRTHIKSPLWVTGDAFRLKQVLYNILGNAVKFTVHGSVSFYVEHSSDESGILFHFHISDTGAGIPEADLEKIFGQFEQAANNQNNYQSTGLGLTIAKLLTEEQGGNITVSSRQDKGSVFTVNQSFASADITPQQLISAAGDDDIPFEGIVWIVDDDPFILQLCSTILAKNNIAHQTFSNPESALDAIPGGKIESVFLDIRMPQMDGITLMHLLKQKTFTEDAQFVALTAQALPDEQQYIMQQGFDELLMKPFMESDLLHMLGIHPQREKQNSSDDFASLKKMTGDDELMIQQIIRTFLQESKEDVQQFEHTMQQQEYTAAADHLHRLAGRCAQLGFTALSASVRHTEISLRNGAAVSKWETDDLLQALQTQLSALATVYNIPVS